MQTTSETYKTLLAKGTNVTSKEVRATIGLDEYYQDQLVEVKTASALMTGDNLIGNCIASTLDIKIRNPNTIPRMEQIDIEVRIDDGQTQSEWLPKGTYFIDTRAIEDDVLHIVAYDAMLKAEQVYVDEGDPGDWPMTDAAVVAEICARVGVELDSRSVLNMGYSVDYPNDLTMREVLGHIGAAYAGNWIITDAGKLRLVPLNASGADVLDLGMNVDTLDTSPAFAAFTKVILWYDDENAYTAGTDAGRTLEADCPWATQETADNVLAAVQGYVYRPFTATGALIDPAAELGDRVTIDDVTYPTASMDVTFDALYTADISAPADEEIDHEYPYLSQTQRQLERKVTLGTAYMGTTIDRTNGLTITKQRADGTKLNRAVLNADQLVFYDQHGNEALYFDPTTGRYKFVGDVTIRNGSININDNFIVDAQGNVVMQGDATIYGGKYYAGTPQDADGYALMRSDGFEVYNADGLLKLLLGYTESGEDYPFIQLGVGDGTGSNSLGLVKKFSDGLWIGNSAPKEAVGTFSPSSGYVGMFFRFTDRTAYVVNGTDMQNIYTGESIARFG